MQNKKITTNQALTLFLLASFSPLISLVAVLTARYGGRAGWVAAFISCGVFCGFAILAGQCFRRNRAKDLYEIFQGRKSRPAKYTAKIIALLYMAWLLALAGYYLRAFSERFAGAIMPGVPAEFFAISLLALIYVIIGGKLQAFAIMSEKFFYVVLVAIAIIFLVQLPKISPENFLPVTIHDSPAILKAALPSLAVFAYFTPLLFLMGDVADNERENFRKFKKGGLYAAVVLLIASLMIFAVTVGVFGSGFIQKTPQPFLTSVKTVGVLDSLERLESLFLLLWVVTDLALIVMLMYAFLKLAGYFCGDFDKTIVFKTPLILGVYVLATSLECGTHEAERLFERVGVPLNVFMGFVLPLIGMSVWCFRGRVKKF
ncbi:MAG: spore germination protein [Oscillospiraceae bacterium]|nr:spore germination protein [Oscillospiraceae bacterium]